jgi:hypothetical protein
MPKTAGKRKAAEEENLEGPPPKEEEEGVSFWPVFATEEQAIKTGVKKGKGKKKAEWVKGEQPKAKRSEKVAAAAAEGDEGEPKAKRSKKAAAAAAEGDEGELKAKRSKKGKGKAAAPQPPHHAAQLTPAQLVQMVQAMREAEQYGCGCGGIGCTGCMGDPGCDCCGDGGWDADCG